MCANAVPVAFLSLQFHSQPVIAVLRTVVQESGRSAEVHDKGVHFAVIVVISEARSPGICLHIQDRPGLTGHICKLAIS